MTVTIKVKQQQGAQLVGLMSWRDLLLMEWARYEEFIPSKIASGEMFLEITPLTFKIRVKVGIPLSQLRLFYGNPDDSLIKGKELYQTVLPNPTNKIHEQDGCPPEPWLHCQCWAITVQRTGC